MELLVWTPPTGHTYTTYPGSKQLFPTLCEPTGTLSLGQTPTADMNGDRGVMMPKRRHTRAHNTAEAINAERRLNENCAATVSELVNPAGSWRAPVPRSNDPPPF